MNNKLRLFISHSWHQEDKLIAQEIAEDLNAMPAFEAWVDYFELVPGDPIQDTIDKTLEQINIVLLLWSQHSAASDNVRKEVDKAIELGCRIIPLSLDQDESGKPNPAFPGKIDQLLWVNVDRDKPKRAISRIILAADKVWNQKLPPEIAKGAASEDELMKQLAGFLQYLAEYQRLEPGHPDRDAWIEKASQTMMKIIRKRGDAQVLAIMKQAAQQLVNTDPQAAKILLDALDDEEGEVVVNQKVSFNENQLLAHTSPLTASVRQHIAHTLNRTDSAVAFRNRLQGMGMEPAQISGIEAGSVNMVIGVPDFLDGAQLVAQQVGLGHVMPSLLQACVNYFVQPHDLIPDDEGLLGLLDDAYLVLAYLSHVSMQYQMETGIPLFNIDFSNQLQVIRSIIGLDITGALDASVIQGYQNVIASIQQQLYAWNQTLNIDQSYHQTPGGWGGDWESEMARMGASMGISFD